MDVGWFDTSTLAEVWLFKRTQVFRDITGWAVALSAGFAFMGPVALLVFRHRRPTQHTKTFPIGLFKVHGGISVAVLKT